MKNIVLLLLLGACGAPKYFSVHPDAVEQYNYMQQEMQNRLGYESVPENFGVEIVDNVADMGENLSSNTVGLCQTKSNGEHRIYLDATYWYESSRTARDMLFAHEWGHCVLDLKHREDMANGYPVSLMFHSNFSERYFEQNREYYINELFH